MTGERPSPRRGGLIACASLAVVLLAGCGPAVVGSASPGSGEPVDVAAADLPITGAADDPVDRLVRDALADIDDFWVQTFPELFGSDFPAVQGGYFSVDGKDIDRGAYPSTGIGCAEEPIDPEQIVGNTVYVTNCDAVAYDRALLRELSHDYGRSLPAVLLAHEFGHVVQGRVGFAASDRSIQDETQADCFAGAWTAWVVAGHARHVAIRRPELDDVLRGYLMLRDPVGSDPEGLQAHGSYFDRVSAFAEGYDGGATTCRDDFGTDRLFTAATFDPTDQAADGNASYDQTVAIVRRTLPAFWLSVFPTAFGRDFREPTLRAVDGAAPACGETSDRELSYCAPDSTVYFDETGLLRPAYRHLGDFAVATAISLPYALAVRSELGLSTRDARATRSAVCLTGWYAAQVFNGGFPGVALSPGDIDEAVEFLLAYGLDDRVFPHVEVSGFELLRAFRGGFLQGAAPCDVGLG